MPKMTAKFSGALATARKIWGLSAKEVQRFEDQEHLYQRIVKEGWMWDSDQKEWIELKNEPADEPTRLVMVRVWADLEVVQEAADEVERALKRKKFNLVEKSPVYPCRPPKQLEGRVYLKLMPPEKNQ